MNKIPGKLILIICALMGSILSNAQSIKSLSEDTTKFSAEIQLLFDNITSPTAGMKIREVLNPFLEYWEGGIFNAEEKIQVIANINSLLAKKATAYPDVRNYISIVYYLKKKGNKEAVAIWFEDFGKWIKKATQRRIAPYLSQYDALVSQNLLYNSTTFIWTISDTSLNLEYDTAIRIVFQKADLTCATRKDTSRILGTSGIFYPNTQIWQGQEGRVTWERVGFNPDSVFADLSFYRINMRESEFEADTVKLVNKRYFKETLYGRLIEKVLATPPGPGSTYPQFVSYLKNYEIRELFKNIDYIGGFSVEGGRIIGSGEINENATLFIKKDGKVRAQIRSNYFRIMGDQISANPASLSIIAGDDSIYHPGLQLKYLDDKRQLVMHRAEDGISESPFFDGFHNLDLNCSAMNWFLDSNSINFESVMGYNRISINEFVSGNFFSKYEFYKLQGIDDKNPLYIVKDFSEKYGTKEVTPAVLSQYMKKSVEQVKAMLLRLSIQGFLYYDLVNDKAIIQDRLFTYLEANAGRRDYDVIRIKSETDNISNASLNLDNYDLLVRGVKEVLVSDSQQVYIFPENSQIVVKKGLDFVFSGNVSAGLFDFYAHDCSFEYDSFKLNIPLIDSLSFKVKSFVRDDRGNAPLVRVASVIENLSGKLLIDHPTNKSGLKSFPEYPIFNSEQESFVYYDRDPLYNRDRFAYHIYPFVLDSLDNFSTDNLSFSGYLVSAGIFPDIGQPLKVQPDYSLGFVNRVPQEGYPAYGGIGNYFSEVNLSNRGLRGKGQLKFLTSNTFADDFHFYPEKMINQVAKIFTIDTLIAQVEYPRVSAADLYQEWYPFRDTMHLQTIKLPFKMYNEKASMYGDLYYASTGLTGSGKVGFESVELASKDYLFRHHTIDADTLDFRLFAKGTEDLVVSAEKYRTHVDFDTRIVEFRTNEKGSAVSFPYNNFVCFMDNIDWYMDQQEMKLYNDLGTRYAGINEMTRQQLLKLDLSGSDFLATNPQADSLSFFSMTARYDLDEYIIEAEDVKLIRVADAAIFPDSNYVKISRGGEIQKLMNAGIIADTLKQYHTIESAEVSIVSRMNYNAKGNYQYQDNDNELQEIPLYEIGADTSGRTYAYADIAEKMKFSLNPHFAYRGKMMVHSQNKELYFEGGFKTREECFAGEVKYWVAFSAWVDPDNVRIPIQQPLADLNGTRLDLGIQISDYEEEIYTTWFVPLVLEGDTAIVAPNGELYFDETSKGYRIARPGKNASAYDLAGYFYNTDYCTMEYAGPLNLGLTYNYVGMSEFGNIKYLAVPDSTTFNLTLTFDFLFYEGSLRLMADSLLKGDLKGLDVTKSNYQAFLDYSLGEDEARDLKEDINNYGKVRRLPDKLNHQIILTDVYMYWNSYTNSYISKGPIGVMSIGKDPVNRYVNGNLELIRRRSGDIITLYLEINPMQYFFFDYRNGIMQSISSDNEFNNRINETKQEKRVLSKPGLDETYEFIVSTRKKVVDFIRRMEPLKN